MIYNLFNLLCVCGAKPHIIFLIKNTNQTFPDSFERYLNSMPSKRQKQSVLTVAEVFAKCAKENRPAFIPYLTAGFPTMESTVPLLLSLQRGGADIIELGMPFSDPLADGPTIQKSSFDALSNGVKLADCFRYVREARDQGLTTPIILMGYYNPFMNYGETKLVDDAVDNTVEGFIVVDLPPDETGGFASLCKSRNLCLVPLVAPTSTDKRLALLAESTTGYVYAVSLTGVTGSRTELSKDLPAFIGRVKNAFKNMPVVVGFGLSTPEHVQQVQGFGAHGAVVGSAIIQEIRKNEKDLKAQEKALEEYVSYMTSKKA